jgi:hypothetical protein
MPNIFDRVLPLNSLTYPSVANHGVTPGATLHTPRSFHRISNEAL